MLIFLLLALVFSVLVAYYQYIYKISLIRKITYLLFALKACVIFFILILIYNPTLDKTIITNKKPTLNILVDNSQSISFLKENDNIKRTVAKIVEDEDLSKKFTVDILPFDANVKVGNNIDFKGNQSNIFNALETINKNLENEYYATILLSDGNQTIGSDYQFFNTKNPLYPVIFGDTLTYSDVSISAININKYNYLNNDFPVEVFLNYSGFKNESLLFTISKSGKIIYRKNVILSKEKRSEIVSLNLKSEAKGLQQYSARIESLKEEKNTKNNIKEFSIEVIDQQSRIAIITSVLHPDIGVLKRAIESNKERKVDIYTNDFKNIELENYQLAIAYQPNERLKAILNTLNTQKKNFLLITGTNSDWSLINSLNIGIKKNTINQTENYFPVFNVSFTAFTQENIGFNEFAPLKDKFGALRFPKSVDNLLISSINGIETNNSLIGFVENSNQKIGFILGEGIWKWRSSSYRLTNSYVEFDNFIGNIIQLLASKEKRERLDVEIEDNFFSNEAVIITVFYRDKNYLFDSRASIQVKLKNLKTNTELTFPFSLQNNAYQAKLENLSPGNYTYEIEVLGQNIKKYGSLSISEFKIEEQFLTANKQKLKQLAYNSKTKLYHKSELDSIFKVLLENQNLQTIQKSNIEKQSLMQWQVLLFIIVFLLAIEWFIRKYFGKL